MDLQSLGREWTCLIKNGQTEKIIGKIYEEQPVDTDKILRKCIESEKLQIGKIKEILERKKSFFSQITGANFRLKIQLGYHCRLKKICQDLLDHPSIRPPTPLENLQYSQKEIEISVKKIRQKICQIGNEKDLKQALKHIKNEFSTGLETQKKKIENFIKDFLEKQRGFWKWIGYENYQYYKIGSLASERHDIKKLLVEYQFKAISRKSREFSFIESIDYSIENKLKNCIELWKKERRLKTSVNEKMREKILKYPDFVELLSDKSAKYLRKEFFHWTFVLGLDPEIFILYPIYHSWKNFIAQGDVQKLIKNVQSSDLNKELKNSVYEKCVELEKKQAKQMKKTLAQRKSIFWEILGCNVYSRYQLGFHLENRKICEQFLGKDFNGQKNLKPVSISSREISKVLKEIEKKESTLGSPNEIIKFVEDLPNKIQNFSEALIKQKQSIKEQISQLGNVHFFSFYKRYKIGKVVAENFAAKRTLIDLKYREIGILFRWNVAGKNILNSLSNDILLDECFNAWKEQTGFKRESSIKDKSYLDTAKKYPKFIELLLKDSGEKLRNEFFQWTFFYRLDPEIFILFPSVVKKIKSSLLAGRIAYYNRMEGNSLLKREGKEVKIRLSNNEENGDKWVNVLDEKAAFTFQGGLVLTIKEIFHVFSQKNNTVGRLEVSEKGIVNWDVHDWGYWEPKKIWGVWDFIRQGLFRKEIGSMRKINLKDTDFLEQLPVQKIVSREEIQEIYGEAINKKMDGKNYMFFIRGSRVRDTEDIEGCHGFLQLAIPVSENSYRLFDFGKFANKFPVKWWEYLLFVGNTVEARVASHDSNIFMDVQRQQAGIGVAISNRDDQMLIKELIREGVKESLSGKMVFQFGWENCAYWPQKVLERFCEQAKDKDNYAHIQRLNKIYKTKIKKTHPLPKSFFGGVVYLFKNTEKYTPLFWTYIFLLNLIMGTWRGKWIRRGTSKIPSYVSVLFTPFNIEQSIFLPSRLHRKIRKFKENPESGSLQKTCAELSFLPPKGFQI